jgi:ADP-heptose:LPS heptosyltransferase
LSSRVGPPRPTVLVYRIGQLGDTLVALPAIDWIRSRHPDARLVLLTDGYPERPTLVSAWDVLSPTGWFDRVIFYDPEGSAFRRLWRLARLAVVLRRLQIDHLYNLVSRVRRRERARDRLYFRWLAAPKSYHDAAPVPPPGTRTGGALPRYDPEWTRLYRMVSGSDAAPDFVLPVPDSARRLAGEVLSANGCDGGRVLIALAPGSKMPAKRWRLERFAAVCRELLAESADVRILVLGGPEDASLGAELRAGLGPGVVNLAGQLSLYGSAAVLERCSLYVGNDTGTMHLAAMVGVRCASIFSARENPGSWEPFGTGHVVLRHETPCAGCMLQACPRGNECLELITVDEVVSAARRIIRP